MRFYVLLLFLNALDAYDLGFIPLQWIMQVGSIAGAVYITLKHPLPKPLGYRSLWLFCLWSALVTSVNALFNDYAPLMPVAATTPYPLFIFLRFLTLLSFVASLYFVYWLLLQGYRDRVVKATVLLASLISIAAIYIYVAQVYGLPELPRTRHGTGGDLQAVTFSYDFHRATGTFREPSLLAAWLIVPFFLSLSVRSRLSYVQAIVIGGAVLLTGSLSGILAVVLGLGVATLAAFTSDLRSIKSLARVLAVMPFGLAVFYLFSVSNTGHGVDLFATLGNRLGPIIVNGGQLSQSDRNYIYDYVASVMPPLLGAGLGNANLQFGEYLGSPRVTSFISLYINVLYSTGIVGSALLGWFLIAPAFKAVTNYRLSQQGRVLLVLAPYAAWLVIFAVAYEEFSFMFAVICALLSYEILSGGSIGGHESKGLGFRESSPTGNQHSHHFSPFS